MSFDGNEGSTISLTDAADATENWRDNHSTLAKGHFIGKKKLRDLINQTGCKGIRFYYGMDSAGATMDLIAVGADANEDDMTNLIINHAVPCPARCGEDNDLNGNAT